MDIITYSHGGTVSRGTVPTYSNSITAAGTGADTITQSY